jgi:hypothetical protein
MPYRPCDYPVDECSSDLSLVERGLRSEFHCRDHVFYILERELMLLGRRSESDLVLFESVNQLIAGSHCEGHHCKRWILACG